MNVVLACWVWSTVAADPETRTWTAKSGDTAQAAFVALDLKEVKLRLSSDKVVAVPFDGLSEDDQQYVYSLAKPFVGELPPEVSRELDKGLGDHATLYWSKQKDDVKFPKLAGFQLVSMSMLNPPKVHSETITAKGREWTVTHNSRSEVSQNPKTKRYRAHTPKRGTLIRVDKPFAVRGVALPKGTLLFRNYEKWEAVDAEKLVKLLKTELKVKELKDDETQYRRQAAVASFAILGDAAKPHLEELKPLLLDQEGDAAKLAQKTIASLEK